MTLLMASTTAILMVSAAFAVDLGFQRATRADVQAVADVVALDLARNVNGRTVAELTPVLDEALADSTARNADVLGAGAPLLDYELGVMNGSDFVPITSGIPTTVRVVVDTSVDYSFAVVAGVDEGTASGDAAAESSSTACFRLGTFVAAIRAGDSTVLSPLNELLGVNLDLVSYQGLADADLRLSQLTAVSTIGSPEALLTGTIQYSDLLKAMATALARENAGTNTVAIEALNKLANSTVATTVGAISLANVLHVAPSDKAALEVALSVLDLVGNARLADGEYFLGVPNIQGQVPGVGFQYTGTIGLISAAELACGAPNSTQAVADTAQLDGLVSINFTNLPSINVATLGTLQTPKGDGTIAIEAGSGTGQLVSPPPVRCGQNTAVDPSTFSVEVDTGLASYKLSANMTVAAEVKVSDLLSLLPLSLITNLLGALLPLKANLEVAVTLTVGTQRAPSSDTVSVSIPPNDTTPVRTGTSVYLDPSSVVPTVTSISINGKAVALAQGTPVTNLVVQALLDPAKGFVDKSLTPLINNINNDFIGPVARMIGLRLAGADVYAVGATCGLPRLVG